jgi:AcrR family transcriptional regulator
MAPIRREQICRAAAAVIAREGFAGSTMRMVAEEAGVSTGMLNHYFANRQDLLTQALVFVSERAQARMSAAVADIPPGHARLAALLDSALAEDDEVTETWRVWINAYGEAVRLPDLRRTIESRLTSWYRLVDRALEGLVSAEDSHGLPWGWRVESMLNGLTILALTSEAALDRRQIRDQVMQMVFGETGGGEASGEAAGGGEAGGETAGGGEAGVEEIAAARLPRMPAGR